MQNIKLKVIWTSIILIISSLCTIGCLHKKVIKREIIVKDGPRQQAIVDSLIQQIYDCESALKAWEKFEDFE